MTDGVNAGELVLTVPQVKGAKGFVHQYTPDPIMPDSEWAQIFSTTGKCTFKNLENAKKYWCRVIAVGPFGQVVVSDAVSRVAQ